MKFIFSIAFLFCLTIDSCQSLNKIKRSRFRRQYPNDLSMPDTASTVLSILPLDRIGSLTGQIMATGLKEMFNPNVGKKLVNVLEVQAPFLLTSLFTNLYSTLRVPARPSASSSAAARDRPAQASSSIQLTNSSTTSQILNSIR